MRSGEGETLGSEGQCNTSGGSEDHRSHPSLLPRAWGSVSPPHGGLRHCSYHAMGTGLLWSSCGQGMATEGSLILLLDVS